MEEAPAEVQTMMDHDLAMRSMNILSDQISELDDRNRDLAGAVGVLAQAIRDIEAEAQDNLDLGRDDLNRIIHICQHPAAFVLPSRRREAAAS